MLFRVPHHPSVTVMWWRESILRGPTKPKQERRKKGRDGSAAARTGGGPAVLISAGFCDGEEMSNIGCSVTQNVGNSNARFPVPGIDPGPGRGCRCVDEDGGRAGKIVARHWRVGSTFPGLV